MALSDGELLALFNRRSVRWVATIKAVRQEQMDVTGRTMGPVAWIGSPESGPWTWLGYYWEPEHIWFGYGFDGKQWLPLIEADQRLPAGRVLALLKKQLPEVWSYTRSGNYLRLWGEPNLAQATARTRAAWLRARGRELNEFSIT